MNGFKINLYNLLNLILVLVWGILSKCLKRYADIGFFSVREFCFFLDVEKYTYSDIYTYQLTIYGFYIDQVLTTHTSVTGWIEYTFTCISLKLRVCSALQGCLQRLRVQRCLF